MARSDGLTTGFAKEERVRRAFAPASRIGFPVPMSVALHDATSVRSDGLTTGFAKEERIDGPISH